MLCLSVCLSVQEMCRLDAGRSRARPSDSLVAVVWTTGSRMTQL